MAAAVATPAPAPSEEQVRLAWRQMRNRGTCPTTLEATLADPVWGRALHGLAVSLSRRNPAGPSAAAHATRLGAAAYVPPDPTPPPRAPTRAVPPRRLAFDGKRAAANDFD